MLPPLNRGYATPGMMPAYNMIPSTIPMIPNLVKTTIPGIQPPPPNILIKPPNNDKSNGKLLTKYESFLKYIDKFFYFNFSRTTTST